MENGSEKLDLTPIAIPIGNKKPLSLQEEIQRFIRSEISENAESKGEETFEEADDFEEENPETLDLSNYEFPEIQEDYIEAPQAPQEGDIPDEAPADQPAPPAESTEAPQENVE